MKLLLSIGLLASAALFAANGALTEVQTACSRLSAAGFSCLAVRD